MLLGAQTRPNDWGLFDMMGNALEWCQSTGGYLYPYAFRGKPIEDKEELLDIKESISRVLRGGSFNLPAVFVRSANRTWYRPSLVNDLVGFRVARTFTP